MGRRRDKDTWARYMREYYRAHPEYVVQCRERARRWREARRHDPTWVEKERARSREKALRDYAAGKRPTLEQRARSNTAWRNRYPERAKAQAAVKRALKRGALNVAERCEWLNGCAAYSQLQAHHADYSKPLQVVWLCPTHHGITRRKAA